VSDVHSPKPKAPKTRFDVPCTACGEGIVGWHVIGTDRWTNEARYCGTLLPRGIDLLDRVPPADDPIASAPLSRFGRQDKARVGTASARHVRSGDQVEAPMYPAEPIKEALVACGIRTRFVSPLALAPFLTWCDRCHASQTVNRPDGAVALA
jgi:hypothetical protein